MNKLLSVFIIIIIFGSAASAAEISGNVVSLGKKLADQKVALSKVNTTQSAETGVVYNFIPLTDTATYKDGSYIFSDINDGMYRVNVTYNGTTYGENVNLQGKAIVDFNLSGEIEGFVLKANKTLESIPVRLLDTASIEIMNTITDKSGKYSFNKVNVGSSYFAEATYADVPYTKLVNASESANFTVYESTKEGDVINVTVDHIVLSKTSNGIKVDEFVEFRNTGDKVFFSKERVWLGISTPEGITRFQTDAMECCLQREKDAVRIDPMKPLVPGETYTAQISYVFVPGLSKDIFYKGMIYNTSYLTLLSEKNNGFGIESKYAKKETVPNQGKEFEVLTFMNIPRSKIIDTQITGYVPSKTGDEGYFNYLIPIFAIVLVGAVSYPFIRKRMAQKPKRRSATYGTPKVIRPAATQVLDTPQEVVENIQQTDVVENVAGKDINEMSFDELLAEKNAAFESILALENRFNAGEIPEQEYKELKKEYRDKAMLVIKQLKEAALNLDLSSPLPVLEKAIAHIDDIGILEELLEREKDGENRSELKEIIEQRIDDIERNEQ